MENDLNRSIRLLEDALSIQGKSPFRTSLTKERFLKTKDSVNISATGQPQELEDVYKLDNEYVSFIDADKTLTGSVIRAREPWKSTFDMLFMEYLEILQTHSHSKEVLETVSDLANCCADALKVAQSLKSKVLVRKIDEDERWIENERNTWRLVYVLYQDRISSQYLQEENEYNQYFGLSEKLCMLSLFKRDSLIRESQLVIDWLECNAAEKDDEVLHFSDSTVGWENTLHQLKSKETIVFESSREIVTQMDPDAPIYENKPLHDLDVEDEKRLCKRMFQEIRCGKLAESQKLAIHSGHAWRAVLLEGWKLHHDPNIEVESSRNGDTDDPGQENRITKSIGDIKETEGNEIRDIWKIMALKICDDVALNIYEKAAIAAYCGYLKVLLPVCKDWEDHLWAHMKVMVDIRVESEVRDCVDLSYKPLPDFYWDQKMSINEIFTILESSNDTTIQDDSGKPERLIQKYLILDQIPQLFEAVDDWISNDDMSVHFLRLVTHLILFLEQIGQATRHNVVEKVLQVYIKCLMEMHETQLVAFYASKLGPQTQISLYSSYLEAITDSNERKQSLRFAEDCSFNLQLLTKTVVENIRNKPHETEETGLQERITAADELKISSIDWLLFYESHLAEALIQTNALIFTFLMMRKIDAAQLVFNKLPTNCVEKIMAEGGVPDNIDQAVREHLSYKSYLDAQEAFNVWFKHFKSKPIAPHDIPENAHLTEKVAHQHRMSQYKAETKRWKLTATHMAKSAKTLLYNVLLFPDGGWLQGADFLRSCCLPECVLLLYTILFESKLYNECMQLADILASEKHGLYKVYSKEKLSDLVGKLSEASVALLNDKMDPWGSSTT